MKSSKNKHSRIVYISPATFESLCRCKPTAGKLQRASSADFEPQPIDGKVLKDRKWTLLKEET